MPHRLLSPTIAFLLSLALSGCPRPQPRPRPRPLSIESLRARLRLPPSDETRQALDELRRRAAQGHRRAGWEAAHYLLDVYDLARLTGDDAARRWLWRALELPGAPRRGAKATRQVLARLTRLARALPADAAGAADPPRRTRPRATDPRAQPPRRAAAAPRGRGAPGPARTAAGIASRAAALRALLRSDRAFLTQRRSVAERVAELRRLKKGPLRYAALLRLYALCGQAFRAAVLASPEARPRILNHCLVPLYDIDASPHFRKKDPPPHPPWSVYRRGMRALLTAAAGAGPRPAEIVSRLRARDRRFFAKQAHRLPLALHGQSEALVRLRAGRPWRGGPAVLRLQDQLISGGKTVERPQERHFRVEMSRLFFAHGKRTHFTLFAPRTLPARKLVALLERAADVGFYTLGLGGVRRLSARRGYWKLTERPPVEPRELSVSLAPSSEAARVLEGLSAQTLRWDARCAGQGLGLVLRPDAVVPAGKDGRLDPVRAEAGLASAALTAASSLKAAFPGECALWLSPGPEVPYVQIVAVARRLAAKGVFEYLGYRIHPPKAPAGGGSFKRRVEQRQAARVTVRRLPRRLRNERESLAQAVRPCYLQALDELPSRWARLSVRSTPEKTLVTQQRGTSPEEVSLNECVAEKVTRWRKNRGLQGLLRLQLRLKPGP